MALKTNSLRRLCSKWSNALNQLSWSFSQNTTELKLKQQSQFQEASLGNRLTRKLWALRLYSRVYKKRQFYWLKPVLQCIKDDSATMRPIRRSHSILTLTLKNVTPEYHFRFPHKDGFFQFKKNTARLLFAEFRKWIKWKAYLTR